MNANGVALVFLGVLVVVQVLWGGALYRLKVLT